MIDHQWTFRLSVFSAAPDDSGEFICSTPHKRTNSIMVRVAGNQRIAALFQELYMRIVFINLKNKNKKNMFEQLYRVTWRRVRILSC